jgi:hypothetical protein
MSKRPDDDPNVVAAIHEGRHAEDIMLLDCPWCGVPSYWNEGSHFTCRACDRTISVCDDDSFRNTQVEAADAYTLADYWAARRIRWTRRSDDHEGQTRRRPRGAGRVRQRRV